MLFPAPGSLIADKYRLEALLGEGGMGAVFRARHELMEKSVAVKWLKPSFGDATAARERFLQEARAAARIHHPNVLDVYDIGVHDGGLFMVMQLLEGESFASTLERAEMPLGAALDHILDAMRGVAAAHAAGIIHRDIKPENIFIAYGAHHPQGCAKILDFGISKLHDGPSAHLTKPGTAIGTPHYMSFEQMRGASDLDHRTDVYSFGVLLYRVLTGVLPFDGETFTAIVLASSGQRPPSPRQLDVGIPAALDQLVMRAIALHPDDRFPTMDALIQALARVRASRDFAARLARPIVPTPVGSTNSERSGSAPRAWRGEVHFDGARRALPAQGVSSGLPAALGGGRSALTTRLVAVALLLAVGLGAVRYLYDSGSPRVAENSHVVVSAPALPAAGKTALAVAAPVAAALEPAPPSAPPSALPLSLAPTDQTGPAASAPARRGPDAQLAPSPRSRLAAAAKRLTPIVAAPPRAAPRAPSVSAVEPSRAVVATETSSGAAALPIETKPAESHGHRSGRLRREDL
jgi:serine/threonine-protein kinase